MKKSNITTNNKVVQTLLKPSFDFSDDEKTDQNNINSNPEDEDQTDDELDEETRMQIYRASQKQLDDIDFDKLDKNLKKKSKNQTNENNQQKKSKVRSQKEILSLGDYSKKVNAEILALKPKKFVSKRVEDKKKLNQPNQPNQSNQPNQPNQLNQSNETNKKNPRHFNPRMPPYNFVHSQTIKNAQPKLDNEIDFPSL